jgi:hypothetical protein
VRVCSPREVSRWPGTDGQGVDPYPSEHTFPNFKPRYHKEEYTNSTRMVSDLFKFVDLNPTCISWIHSMRPGSAGDAADRADRGRVKVGEARPKRRGVKEAFGAW